ncbi:hypothetical protein DVH26_25575 [Paenibacillus sp. H1-7]|uniref:hypothetical protein n=1 Tax=Paenibacillus sp. H1-7 TaxID=2282849 RepID=UPI001EF8A1FF|nr:hypothetical protein [Paenibacillus sp. H1-7]ULL17525.1 hypothetical protein DVH26_25575 [Paenibacillus sp. H1-7]
MKRHGLAAIGIAGALLWGSAFQIPAWAADNAASANVKTAAQVAEELGLLQGDGNGVSDAYLSKTTTRLQSAILFLRLKGLEHAAMEFRSADNFSDANQVNDANKSILAYLKANPQLGWTGTGNGAFEPSALITSSQYYKVLLETLGYKQDSDFRYEDVLDYAKQVGLSRIADAGSLRNDHIATATVEALALKVKGSGKTLADLLSEQKVIDPAKAESAKRVSLRVADDKSLGSYLTDQSGRTLYVFAKDTQNVSACKDQCAVNWPVYYENNLWVPSELHASDFQTIIREDGKQQLTYRGQPLYYYINDEKPGDVKGHGVNNLWKAAGYSAVQVTNHDKGGTMLTDSKGRTLYTFTKDSLEKSACYGACEANWPIFYSSHAPLSGGFAADDFGTISREDGTKQTTFRGQPLYYFFKDEKAGDMLGQGLNNVWFIVDPSAK